MECINTPLLLVEHLLACSRSCSPWFVLNLCWYTPLFFQSESGTFPCREKAQGSTFSAHPTKDQDQDLRQACSVGTRELKLNSRRLYSISIYLQYIQLHHEIEKNSTPTNSKKDIRSQKCHGATRLKCYIHSYVCTI